MHPYNADLYYDDIVKKQGYVFLSIREELPGVDEKWFISEYMRSNTRKFLDHANPKYAAMTCYELIEWFINWEQNGKYKDYKRGETWGGFLPQWAGHMYAHYQWQYNMPSAELVEMLPLEVMERLYVPLHQIDYTAAAEKIHESVFNYRR